MQFILCAVGSRGDVFPLLAIAGELCRRGHRAIVIAGDGLRDIAAPRGVDYVCLASEEEHRGILRDKQILSTRYGALFVARHSVRWNELILEAIEARLTSDSVVVTSERLNIWADLVARRHFGIPVVRAVIDLPFLPGLRPVILPPGRVQRMLDHRVGSVWAEYLERRGIKSTLNHVQRVYRSVRPSIPTIALWPAWIPGTGSLRGVNRAFGFMPWPGAYIRRRQGMRTGNSGHIVFLAGTEGTMAGWLKQFIDTSAKVCLELGLKGVLMGGTGSTEDSRPGSTLESIQFTPLREVLVGAAAIVHHGGIGTAAEALECGVPQVCIPRVFMQPTNAEWMRRLGVCLVIDAKQWVPHRAPEYLRNVLNNQELGQRAKEVAYRIDRAAALVAVCDYLEEPANYIPNGSGNARFASCS